MGQPLLEKEKDENNLFLYVVNYIYNIYAAIIINFNINNLVAGY